MLEILLEGSWGSAVIMVKKMVLWLCYGLDSMCAESYVRIIVRDFSFLLNIQTGSGAQQTSYSVGTRVVFRG